MKLGIMSMQRVVNYGSFLQAYGLKAVLESMGHSVEFVDYLQEPSLLPGPPTTAKSRLAMKIRNLFRMLRPSYRRWREEQIRLNRSFSDFYNEFQTVFLPRLGLCEKRNLCPELDVLIIGSDEVFNCTQPGTLVGYSPQLFGKDHRAKKLISYAASFGYSTMEKLEQFGVADEVGKYLCGFDRLSVRDAYSSEIAAALTGKQPLCHIDPVLLYDFPEVHDIGVSLRNYIIVYAYADRISASEAQVIRAFAEKHRKKILSLGFWQPFCDEAILAAPLEVLSYIKHADFVVTDTFHGTVFSIKYQVPFATIVRDSNQQKLRDLLSRFHLEDREVRDMNNLETVLHSPLDPAAVNALLKQYQSDAMQYLRDELVEESGCET